MAPAVLFRRLHSSGAGVYAVPVVFGPHRQRDDVDLLDWLRRDVLPFEVCIPVFRLKLPVDQRTPVYDPIVPVLATSDIRSGLREKS
jgi:hypothetical protein